MLLWVGKWRLRLEGCNRRGFEWACGGFRRAVSLGPRFSLLLSGFCSAPLFASFFPRRSSFFQLLLLLLLLAICLCCVSVSSTYSNKITSTTNQYKAPSLIHEIKKFNFDRNENYFFFYFNFIIIIKII